MKTYNNLYEKIYRLDRIIRAWRKARKGKTKKKDIREFERNTIKHLLDLHNELKNQTYAPKELTNFPLRDPKTRVISKSDFRDRIVHHIVVSVIEPIFEPLFIYDSYANRTGKGTLKAIQRFDYFARKVSQNGKIKGLLNNNQIIGYCLKADIKHYFQTVNHEVLISIIMRKITDNRVIKLIEKIVANSKTQREREREIYNFSRRC